MVLLGHESGSRSLHRGWKAHTFLKIPRWDGASASSPCTLGTASRPIPTEAMKSLQPLHLTGAASREIRARKFPNPRSQGRVFLLRDRPRSSDSCFLVDASR